MTCEKDVKTSVGKPCEKSEENFEENFFCGKVAFFHGIYAENSPDTASKNKLQVIHDIIKKYPTVLQMHGFYVDEENKSINYDLVISFDDPNPEETISRIKEETERENDGYTVFVQYDQDFSLSE